MESLVCNYVPPYVRAEAAATKYPVEVEICGEYYRLPYTEIEGEKAWYRDFKQIIIGMYVAWLCSVTRDEWEALTFNMVMSLVRHTGFHLIEARAVVHEATVAADRLMEMENDQVFRDEFPAVAAMYDVEYKRQLARLQALVKEPKLCHQKQFGGEHKAPSAKLAQEKMTKLHPVAKHRERRAARPKKPLVAQRAVSFWLAIRACDDGLAPTESGA